ncbi:hypothetical protein ERJ75_000698100 [Trypanosoma vivax]|nr:hypothetical protein ERJ75_000698100 [Trypanosoma vivax]
MKSVKGTTREAKRRRWTAQGRGGSVLKRLRQRGAKNWGRAWYRQLLLGQDRGTMEEKQSGGGGGRRPRCERELQRGKSSSREELARRQGQLKGARRKVFWADGTPHTMLVRATRKRTVRRGVGARSTRTAEAGTWPAHEEKTSMHRFA